MIDRIPLILAVSICRFATRPSVSLGTENPNFKYGKTQALVATAVLVISFLGNFFWSDSTDSLFSC